MKKTNRNKKRGNRGKNHSDSTASLVNASEIIPESEKKDMKTKSDQPTLKKEIEKRREQKWIVLQHVETAVRFLRESRMELRKVKWPNRKELLASTAMVIFLVLVVSLFLGIIDFGLIKVIKNIVG